MFPQPVLHFLFLPAMHKCSRFSIFSPVFAISHFLNVPTLAGVRWYLWFSSALPQWLMMLSTFSDICWLFVCLWKNVLFQVLAHLCMGLVLLFIWGLYFILLNTESFSVSDWQVFSTSLQFVRLLLSMGGSSLETASWSAAAGRAVWHATGKGGLTGAPITSIFST